MEQKIKRRTAIILISMLVICASLVTGVIYLYNDIFPKAGPIRCPDVSVKSPRDLRSRAAV